MFRRGWLLVVLIGSPAVVGCSHRGAVIRTEAPKSDEEKPVRINNAESPTVERWSGSN